MPQRACVVQAARAAAEQLEERTLFSVLTVNSTADNITETAHLTLREAITLIENGGNPSSLGQMSMPAGWASQIDTTQPFGTNDTIQFASSIFTNNAATISLTTAADTTDDGSSAISITGGSNFTIQAPVGDTLDIDGGGQSFRALYLQSGATLSLDGINITNFSVGANHTGGGISVASGASLSLTNDTFSNNHSSGVNGAISNGGTLTINGGSFTNNSASVSAGAIGNGGALNVTGVTFSGNSAIANNGGAIYNAGHASFNSCVFANNQTSNSAGGGAIFSTGTLTANGDVFQGNKAPDGGAVAVYGGTSSISNSTFNANSASEGEGAIVVSIGLLNLYNATVTNNVCTNTVATYITGGIGGGGGIGVVYGGTLNAADCTIVGNETHVPGGGGGILVATANPKGSATLTNCIIADNTNSDGTTPNDIYGALQPSSSNNLIGPGGSGGITNGTSGNIVLSSNANLGLGTLGNYGGTTQTIPLLPGSPAIGAGINTDIPGTMTAITADERGYPLPTGGTRDVGAFQYAGTYTITVNDTADVLDNPTTSFNINLGSKVSLRDAINAANNTYGVGTIVLPSNATFDFTTADNDWYGPDALPAIDSNITIQGNGSTLQRDGSLPATTAGAFRFFYVSGGIATELPLGTLTLENLTMTHGLAKGGDSFSGGGGLGAGGAIFNQGSLTLNGVTLVGNEAMGGNSDVIGAGAGGGGMGQNAQGGYNGGGFGPSFPTGLYGSIGGSGSITSSAGRTVNAGGGGGFSANGSSPAAGGLSGLGAGGGDGGTGESVVGTQAPFLAAAGGDFGGGGSQLTQPFLPEVAAVLGAAAVTIAAVGLVGAAASRVTVGSAAGAALGQEPASVAAALRPTIRPAEAAREWGAPSSQCMGLFLLSTQHSRPTPHKAAPATICLVVDPPAAAATAAPSSFLTALHQSPSPPLPKTTLLPGSETKAMAAPTAAPFTTSPTATTTPLARLFLQPSRSKTPSSTARSAEPTIW